MRRIIRPRRCRHRRCRRRRPINALSSISGTERIINRAVKLERAVLHPWHVLIVNVSYEGTVTAPRKPARPRIFARGSYLETYTRRSYRVVCITLRRVLKKLRNSLPKRLVRKVENEPPRHAERLEGETCFVTQSSIVVGAN